MNWNQLIAKVACLQLKQLIITFFLFLCTASLYAQSSGATIDLSDNTTSVGTGWSYSDGIFTVTDNVTITGTTTSNRIVVASGETVNITLDDASIDVNSCAFDMSGANVTLTLTGNNELKSGVGRAGLEVPAGSTLTIEGVGSLTATSSGMGAGIGGGAERDGGIITISGGNVTAVCSDYGGAGVGGGYLGASGDITISGDANLTATGGANDVNNMGGGAGIGSGGSGTTGPAGALGNIIINTTGTVEATGGTGAGVGALQRNGAAIGYGGQLDGPGAAELPTAPQNVTATLEGSGDLKLEWDAPGTVNGITITGYEVSSDNGITWEPASTDSEHTFIGVANVIAYCLSVRALFDNGYGMDAILNTIPPGGSTIDLSDNLTFVGTGWSYSNGVFTVTDDVTITGTTTNNRIVVATGATVNITLYNASIEVNSCAFDMSGATVTLTLTGNNELKSGVGRAGLEVPAGSTLTIEGTGSLIATSSGMGAGIGGGSEQDGGTITISGGNVTAVCSDYGGAGVGGGYLGASGDITISGDANLNATGGANDVNNMGGGAGIGSGGSGSTETAGALGNIIINTTGTVEATGGTGAGVGASQRNGAAIGYGGQLDGPGAAELPTAPQNVTATPEGSEELKLEWDAPVTVNGITITGYEVSSDNGVTWEPASSDTEHTFTGLVSDTEYYLKVRALFDHGYGIEESINETTGVIPTYSATLSLNKDNSPWNSHGKNFTLKLETDETINIPMTGTDATLTATATDGVWKIYDDTDFTGKTITINNDDGHETLNYYTIIFDITDDGEADNSTISATYNGEAIESDTIVIGGKTLIITAVGEGVTSYEYAWSGVYGTETITLADDIFTITPVIGKVEAHCTVTGIAEPNYLVTVSSDGIGATGGGRYKEGETVSISAGIPPVGMTFSNWTITPADISLNDENASATFTMPASDVTVTAYFEPEVVPTYTLTYHANNGTNAPQSEMIPQNTLHNISAVEPWRIDYLFLGWSVESAATTIQYAPGDPIYMLSDTTLFAVWASSTTYSVTVSGGTGATGGGNYGAGATVTISAGAPPTAGQIFKNWTSVPSVIFDDPGIVKTTFIMPASNVTETAVFETVPPSAYIVHTGTFSNGAVLTDKNYSEENETVTLSVLPASGYALDTIVVYKTGETGTTVLLSGNGNSTGSTRTFTMPAYDVTVAAFFTKTNDQLALEAVLDEILNTAYTIEQDTANTLASVRNLLLEVLEPLLAAADIHLTASNINFLDFIAAISGDGDNPLGTDGSFDFRLSLTKGDSHATLYLNGVIMATIFDTSGNEAIQPVKQLKAWIQNGELQVSGLTQGKQWRIYHISGTLVYQGIALDEKASIRIETRGYHIIVSEGKTIRIMLN